MKLTLNYLYEELTKEQMSKFFDYLLRNLECPYSIKSGGEEIEISGSKRDILKAIELFSDFKKSEVKNG